MEKYRQYVCYCVSNMWAFEKSCSKILIRLHSRELEVVPEITSGSQEVREITPRRVCAGARSSVPVSVPNKMQVYACSQTNKPFQAESCCQGLCWALMQPGAGTVTLLAGCGWLG